MVDYKRQTLIFDPASFSVNVVVVGLGNIGSHTALTLTRLGVQSFILYDHDKVEPHNLSSQGYDVNDLSEWKGLALRKKMEAMNPQIRVLSQHCKYEGGQLISGAPSIFIIAVDSMEEREKIYRGMKKSKASFDLLIDARVGGGQLEIYSCTTLDIWNKTFVSSPAPDPCGGRFICYTSVATAALITNQVKRFLKGESIQEMIMFHFDSLELIKQ